MKICSIGNSFSQDAQRYLHRLAKSAGFDMKTINLYIGGCSLQTHYVNMINDVPAYDFERNGETTGIKSSIKQALNSDTWDIITLQQVSNLSGKYETFSPYLQELASYVRKTCPKAKLLIHETWAYENGSQMLIDSGYSSSETMQQAVRDSYKKAVEEIHADGIIPSGEAILNAIKTGIKIHRDGFHASFGLGRYILALTWYKTLTGADISNIPFDDFDEPITPEEKKIAIESVKHAFIK